MRPGLTVDQFRAAGIYLNGGRKRGWRKRIARLLKTPEATIAAWASRSPSNARPIPGAAAVAIKLLMVMLQQREISERNLVRAAEIVTEQVLTMVQLPDFARPPAHIPLQETGASMMRADHPALPDPALNSRRAAETIAQACAVPTARPRSRDCR